MIRRIFTLLFLFFLISTPSYSADTNWVADTGSSNGGSTTGTPTGTIPEMFDENDATFYGGSTFGAAGTTTIAESDFASTHYITSIKIVIMRGTGWLIDIGTNGTYTVEAYYSSAWHTIQSAFFEEMLTTGSPTTVTISGLTLNDVSKVKLTVVDDGGETGYGWLSDAWINEIYAYGTDPAGYSIIY